MKLSNVKCRICEETKQLCKAHLFPDSFKTLLDSFQFVSAKLDASSIRTKQTLEFDPNILCSSCDNLLGKYDREAVHFLRDWFNHPARDIAVDSDKVVRSVEISCSTRALELFFAGTCLRFAITDRHPSIEVRAAHRRSLIASIRDTTYSNSDFFSVILLGTDKPPYNLSAALLAAPQYYRLATTAYFEFHMFGIWAMAKLGYGDWPPSIANYPRLSDNETHATLPLLSFRNTPLIEPIEILLNARRAKDVNIKDSLGTPVKKLV